MLNLIQRLQNQSLKHWAECVLTQTCSFFFHNATEYLPHIPRCPIAPENLPIIHASFTPSTMPCSVSLEPCHLVFCLKYSTFSYSHYLSLQVSPSNQFLTLHTFLLSMPSCLAFFTALHLAHCIVNKPLFLSADPPFPRLSHSYSFLLYLQPFL